MSQWFPAGDVTAGACFRHITDDEVAAYEAALAAARAPIEAARPACWSWPVPDGPAPSDELGVWQYLLDWHQDRCALCGRLAAIMEDHDHDTGLTRGWLCAGCNLVEGKSRSQLLARYRDRPAAAVLGVRLTYTTSVWLMPIRRVDVIAGADPLSLIDNPSPKCPS